MTKQGASELYMWQMAAWPTVIRPGASESFANAKIKQIYETYKSNTDEEVFAAFEKWAQENEKYPTTKNILNEIQWARRLKMPKNKENVIYWPMDVIYDDGNEWTYGSFKREDFVNHHRNPDHLQPEEWERRFKLRRRAIMAKLYPVELTPKEQALADDMFERLKRMAAYKHAESM